MFINCTSFYCIKTNITPDQLTNHAIFTTKYLYSTRSREFPITPVWMIVRFSQVNFIEIITKLDQKAVRYSVLTGYGLFRVF